MDMNDRTLVMVMTQGIGANLTNDEKRAQVQLWNAMNATRKFEQNLRCQLSRQKSKRLRMDHRAN